MHCSRCQAPAVLFQSYSGRSLCARHLCTDIESRAKRVIRQNQWLKRGDRIGVVSGLIHSAALMIFLRRLIAGRPDITLTWIAPEPECRPQTPAWYHHLNLAGTQADCTRIALPFCLDDIATDILTSLIRGDSSSLLTTEIPGLSLPFMQPLREIPAGELQEYAGCLMDTCDDCVPAIVLTPSDLFEDHVRGMLTEFSSRHPSAPHALCRYRDQLHTLKRD